MFTLADNQIKDLAELESTVNSGFDIAQSMIPDIIENDPDKIETLENLNAVMERLSHLQREVKETKGFISVLKKKVIELEKTDTDVDTRSLFQLVSSEGKRIPDDPSKVQGINMVKMEIARLKSLASSDLHVAKDFEKVRDPITKKAIDHPMKSKTCAHLYDKISVLQYLINTTANKGKNCPYTGCTNRNLTIKDLMDIAPLSSQNERPVVVDKIDIS